MVVRLSLLFGCVCAGLTLNGCAANDPRPIQFQSAETLDARRTNEILLTYAFEAKMVNHGSKTSKLRHEFERRSLFDTAQWELIDEKKISIGQLEHLVWGSRGTPDRIDRLPTPAGVPREMVYERTSRIVYIEDGQFAAALG